MLARILPWDVAMPTLKSSAVDSIPSMIDGFLAGFLGKCWWAPWFLAETRRFLFLDCINICLKIDKGNTSKDSFDLCLNVMIWSIRRCISFRIRGVRVCCSLICGVGLALAVVKGPE